MSKKIKGLEERLHVPDKRQRQTLASLSDKGPTALLPSLESL